MTVSRERFVEVTRGFVGTPYLHLGRVPGEGLDCAGVPLCAMVACGLEVPAATYGIEPSKEQAEHWLKRYGRRRAFGDRLPGDVLVMRHGGSLGHMAVVVGEDVVVHARARRNGCGKVVEVPLHRSMHVLSCWSLRGVG